MREAGVENGAAGSARSSIPNPRSAVVFAYHNVGDRRAMVGEASVRAGRRCLVCGK